MKCCEVLNSRCYFLVVLLNYFSVSFPLWCPFLLDFIDVVCIVIALIGLLMGVHYAKSRPRYVGGDFVNGSGVVLTDVAFLQGCLLDRQIRY